MQRQSKQHPKAPQRRSRAHLETSVTPHHVPAMQKSRPLTYFVPWPFLPGSTGVQNTQEINHREKPVIPHAPPEGLPSAAPGTSLCHQVADAEDNLATFN